MNEASRAPSSSGSTNPNPSTSGAPSLVVSPRLLRGVLAVRMRLPTAKDLGKLYECFDDRIARAPELWQSSRAVEHPLLVSVAVAVGRRYRPGFQPTACKVLEIGDTGFIHGAVFGTTGLACAFYDEHVGMGLVALCNPFDGSSRTDFVRFGPPVLGPPSHDEAAPRMPC